MLEWEATLNDESEPRSCQVEADANVEAIVEPENRITNICNIDGEDMISNEVKYSAEYLVVKEFSKMSSGTTNGANLPKPR